MRTEKQKLQKKKEKQNFEKKKAQTKKKTKKNWGVLAKENENFHDTLK